MTYSNTYSSPSSPTNFNPFSGMGMRKGGRPSLFPGSGDGSTLNLDFTTGVLDSRLTFSRASTATFVNSSGYVAYADTNLFANSQFSGTSQPTNWDKTTNWDGTIPPAGGRRVTTDATGASKYLACTIAIQPGLTYSASVYVSEVSGQHYANTITPTGSAVVSKIYRNGVNVGSIYNTAEPGLITTVFSQPSGTTNSIRIGLGCTGSVIINGVCQFSQPRCVPGDVPQPTYFASPVATSYHAPRFDYSPTNIGEPRGLLIEGSSINPILYSQDFSQATWSKSNATVTAPTTAPDGTTTAYLLTSTTAGGIISQTHAATGNATSTYSIYVKQGTAAYCDLYIYDAVAGATRLNVRFTFATKVFTVTAGSNAVYQELTNGWFRISAICTALSTTNNIISYLYVGFAVAGTTYYGWGAQLEAGSGASSYIVTGASQVTRNADQCELTSGVPALYDSATGTGTLLIDISHSALQNGNGGIELGAGTGNQGVTNRVSCRRDATFVGGTTLNLTPTGADQRFKTVTAFAPSDLAASRNGNSAVTSSTNVTLTGMTALKFYIDAWAGGSLPVYGAVRQVKMWPTRLPNATLQTLSAL